MTGGRAGMAEVWTHANVAVMSTRTEWRAQTAAAFLARAGAYLAEGDLLQASEKGWGAAARALKAAAETRGWRHGSHRDLYTVVARLVSETGDPRIRTWFGVAGDLRANCCEGWLPAEIVEGHLSDVELLVAALGELSS